MRRTADGSLLLLAAADGVDGARVSRLKDGFEISVGGDRYRLPVRMLSHAKK